MTSNTMGHEYISKLFLKGFRRNPVAEEDDVFAKELQRYLSSAVLAFGVPGSARIG